MAISKAAASLARYIRWIEEFLAGGISATAFSEGFFDAFQADPETWPDAIEDQLSAVAMACEAYSPEPPLSEHDISEAQLRSEIAEHLVKLHRLRGEFADEL